MEKYGEVALGEVVPDSELRPRRFSTVIRATQDNIKFVTNAMWTRQLFTTKKGTICATIDNCWMQEYNGEMYLLLDFVIPENIKTVYDVHDQKAGIEELFEYMS